MACSCVGNGFKAIQTLVVALLLSCGSAAQAQYIGINSPFQTFTDSYYSRVGVNFGFQIPGARSGNGVVGLLPNGQIAPDGMLRFSQGGFGAAVPPFGGYDPGADAHLGFRVGGGSGPGFNFNIVAGQGSSRSASMVSPSIVIPNGGSGMIFDGQVRPFVTGFVPVVGAMPPAYYSQPVAPTYINPIHYKLALLDQQLARGERANVWEGDDESYSDSGLSLSGSGRNTGSSSPSTSRPDRSTASQPARSLAEIRRERSSNVDRQEQERREKFLDHLAAADYAIERGLERSARYNLDRALQYASSDADREAIDSRLREIE